MKVVVLGGHVVIELSKRGISPSGLVRCSGIEKMVVGAHVHVCM